jgi:D-alanyl-D-alanine carboxypeptidase
MARNHATAAPHARPLHLPEERLQALVEGLVGRRGSRHAVLAVESMDGSARWQGAAGTADGEGAPMRVETPYFIASADKLYTAAAILKLCEGGKLDLHARLASLLPPELTSRIHVEGGVDRSDQITVRHLLGHTSGLADYLEDRPRGGKSLVERLFAGEEGTVPGAEEAMSWVREHLRPHFPPQDPSSPRSRARYCDTNFLLLIAILERVWGKPLHEVYAEAVFRPAGLAQTYVLGASEPLVPTLPPAAL